LLYRGDRQLERGGSKRADEVLGPVADELAALGASAERVVYADDAIGQVAEQVAALDGVLVWVNPIQDGANRAQLDEMLRDVSARGVWVSSHPDVIGRMGTKEILFHTRMLGWGTDTDLYRSPAELAERFPAQLMRAGRLVVKQARGNGGNGVWRVDATDGAHLDVDSRVLIEHALSLDVPPEEVTLGTFFERCGEYFAWSGSLISQPYQTRLPDGMIRCYFLGDRVVGFCHQWPRGLLDPSEQSTPADATRPARAPWEDADTPRYRALRTRAESDWVPGMQKLLGLAAAALPAIWDADFLYGPRDAEGNDTYVLCEVNVSCVWPFPPQATRRIAERAINCVTTARLRGQTGEPSASDSYDVDHQ
jgi:hypothetical protein